MLKLFHPLVVVAMLVLVTPPGATPEGGGPGRELALLGDARIREADFLAHLSERYPDAERHALLGDPPARARALEGYLDWVAVAAKGRQLGIDREPRFLMAVELMELKVLAQLMTERNRARIVRDVTVTPDQVRSYYEAHKAELATEPTFTVRQLVVYVRGNPAFPQQGRDDAAARARAQVALAQLRAGASWDAVALEYSDDPGTRDSGGLIRDGQFGFQAPEVDAAIRTQPLGAPGGVVKSAFGYHVLEVESRVTERAPRPFAEVEEVLREKLQGERAVEARKAFMAPLWQELGFEVTAAGKRDAFLLDEGAVGPTEVLARIGERELRERDFQWFVKDALLPEQRASAYSRPGARQSMLSSYLDMVVLETKARRDGLDRSPEFLRTRATLRDALLLEFVRAREGDATVSTCGQPPAARREAERDYFTRLRAEVGLRVAP